MGRRRRVFVAIDVPPKVRERAVALQDRLARLGPGVKWVEPANLHLTLLFLGELDDRDVVAVCREVGRQAAGVPAFAVRFAGLGGFPNARRPRVLWLGVTEGADELRHLHATLEGPLLELGCYRREDRPYTPHLTLGRCDGGPPAGLAEALDRSADETVGDTTAREVCVYQSELKPAGPEYTALSRAPLGG